MKRKLCSLLLLIALLTGALSLSAWSARRSTDPMTTITDVRALGMERAGLATLGGSNALFSNPAGLVKVKTLAASTFTTKLMEDFNYFGINGAMKTDWGWMGLGYGSMSIDTIPETFRYSLNGATRTYKLSEYDAGNKVYILGYASNVTVPFLNELALGLSIKRATEYINAPDAQTFEASESTGWGGDIGVLMPVDVFGQKCELGLAFQNALAPEFREEGEESSYYAMNTRIGISTETDLFGQHFLFALDNDILGLHAGGEWQAAGGFAVRAGTSGTVHSVGLGLKVFSITGFDNKPHSIAIDYAMQMQQTPLNNVNFLSFSYLGVSQTERPAILTPVSGITAVSSTISVEGTAAKDSEVTLYVNNVPQKIIVPDMNSGVWKVDNVYLAQGSNELKAVAQQLEFAASEYSDPVIVFAQLKPPALQTIIERHGTEIIIKAKSAVALKQVATRLPNRQVVALAYDPTANLWAGNWQVPFEMMDKSVILQTRGVDTYGLKTDIVSDRIYTRSVMTPSDKSSLMKDATEVKGQVPVSVKKVIISGQEVTPGPDGTFSAVVNLQNIGKQTVSVKMIDDRGRERETEVRVMRKASAADVPPGSSAYNAVNDLLTIGALQTVSGNTFSPKQSITRGELAQLIIRMKGMPVSGPGSFKDVPPASPYAAAINTVAQAGLLQAYPDGTFKPDGTISRAETAVLLVRLNGVEIPDGTPDQVFEDVKLSHPLAAPIAAAVQEGLIPADEDNFYPDEPLDRETAATWFARTKEFKQQVREMQKWEEPPQPGADVPPEQLMESSAVVDLAAVQWSPQEQQAGLKVLEPMDQSTTYEKYAIVKGIVTPQMAVSVNGKNIPVEKGGLFIAGVPLEIGVNMILVETAKERKQIRVLREGAFNDVPSDDIGVNMKKFGSLGYLETADNSFNPELAITRREMAVVLVRLKENTPATSSRELKDIAGDDPQLAYMRRAVDLGYLSSMGGSFLPENVIRRGEAVAMIDTFQGLEIPQAALQKAPFPDVAMDHPYAKAIAVALQAGILPVTEKFYPDDPLTREDLVNWLSRTSAVQSKLSAPVDWNNYDSKKVRTPVLRRKGLVVQSGTRTMRTTSEGAESSAESGDSYLQFAPPMTAQLKEGVIYPRTADSVGAGGQGLTIVAPQDLLITTKTEADVAGVAGPGVQVQVNGKTVPVNANGAFQTKTGLIQGKNIITIMTPTVTEKRRVLRLLTYNDINGLTQKRVIEYLATLGYFAEGPSFYPTRPVSKAELVTLALKAGNITPVTPQSQAFGDVPLSNWAAPSIYTALNTGIIEKKNAFSPDADISRGEAISILLRAQRTNIPTSTLKAPLFNDVAIGHPYANVIAVAAAMGIIDRGGTFRPDAPVTRTDLAVWMVKMDPIKKQIVALRDFSRA